MTRSLSAIVLSGALCFGLTGCPEEKGPMEKAGEALDDAGETVTETVEDLTQEKGPMEKAGEKLDDAGRDLDEAAQDAKESIQEATDGK